MQERDCRVSHLGVFSVRKSSPAQDKLRRFVKPWDYHPIVQAHEAPTAAQRHSTHAFLNQIAQAHFPAAVQSCGTQLCLYLSILSLSIYLSIYLSVYLFVFLIVAHVCLLFMYLRAAR